MSIKMEQKLFHMAKQEKILVPERLENRIDNLLKNLPRQKPVYQITWRKSLVLVAVLMLLFSITATATASLLQQRMDAMNKEKLEEFWTQLYASKLPADNYNRPLSEAERQRMEVLQSAYLEQGTFPQKELLLIEDADSYKGKGIAYLADTGTFFLPEKELSDEQLLQLIDFRTKRDYALASMNELLENGEADIPTASEVSVAATGLDILESDAIWNPEQELTIPYTGELSIHVIGAGNNSIFLGGYNSIHKMEIGSNTSTPFFEDFTEETRILALCQDQAGTVYATGWEWLSSETVKLSLWMIDEEGSLLRKVDLSPYREKDKTGMVRRIAVDESGNIYLSGQLSPENNVLVLNQQGELISRIDTGAYRTDWLGGLGIGKDGLAYLVVLDSEKNMGIASINLQKGELNPAHMGIVPEGTIILDVVAKGVDTDFVFWGYDGIFIYNLGEEAVKIMPAYEAPCQWEGALYCVLPDGRVVFANSTDYTTAPGMGGIDRYLAVPEKTTFYYISTINRPEK